MTFITETYAFKRPLPLSLPEIGQMERYFSKSFADQYREGDVWKVVMGRFVYKQWEIDASARRYVWLNQAGVSGER